MAERKFALGQVVYLSSWGVNQNKELEAEAAKAKESPGYEGATLPLLRPNVMYRVTKIHGTEAAPYLQVEEVTRGDGLVVLDGHDNIAVFAPEWFVSALEKDRADRAA